MDTPFLYLITPDHIADADAFACDLHAALAAGGGQISAVQLRLKGVDDDTVRRVARTLMPVAQAAGVMFILNDRADLAAETGCDGVHLGQADGSVPAARALLGPKAIIGVTCHASRDLAIAAADAGADYVAFGAFYPTTTKQVTHHADSEVLRWAQDFLLIPCVAIGGITPDTAADLRAAGADMLAVSAAIWQHANGPAAGVTAFVSAANRVNT